MPAPTPTCPGIRDHLAGPPTSGPSIVCGPLALDREAEEQGRHQEKASRVVFTSRHDPSTFHKACCGDYTSCVIWRAEKRRLELEKDGVTAPLGIDPEADTAYGAIPG